MSWILESASEGTQATLTAGGNGERWLWAAGLLLATGVGLVAGIFFHRENLRPNWLGSGHELPYVNAEPKLAVVQPEQQRTAVAAGPITHHLWPAVAAGAPGRPTWQRECAVDLHDR